MQRNIAVYIHIKILSYTPKFPARFLQNIKIRVLVHYLFACLYHGSYFCLVYIKIFYFWFLLNGYQGDFVGIDLKFHSLAPSFLIIMNNEAKE